MHSFACVYGSELASVAKIGRMQGAKRHSQCGVRALGPGG